MAGDWIKIEHTLPDKPEVVRMAMELAIDQDAVAGKLLRLWIWADQNTVGGNDIPVTNSFLDRLTACPGFAVAMREVGWLEGREGSLSFPRFDRHNGQTAKLRAETNRRVAKSRAGKLNATKPVALIGNENVTQKPLQKPLPEKRREELDSKNLSAPPVDFPEARLGSVMNPKASLIKFPDGRLLDFEDDMLVWQAEFIRQWNRLPGVSKHLGSALNFTNLRALTRNFHDPDWDWAAAFARFPVWRPRDTPASMSWFLSEGTVNKILEGECQIRQRVTAQAQTIPDAFSFTEDELNSP